MVYKTSDIYKILKTATSMDKSSFFKMGDVVCAKERRSTHPLRQELLKISPNLLRILEERDLLKEHSVGYGLTERGYSILKEFEEARKKYGRNNVELIPAMIEGKTTYKVRVNPKVKIEIKTKPLQIVQKFPLVAPEPSEKIKYEQRKKHMLNFLSEPTVLVSLENVKIKEGYLTIKTKVDYHRTREERDRLDKIAEKLGMGIITKDESWYRNYVFVNEQKQPVVSIISRKDKKGFKSYKPLEVEVDLTQPTESAEKLVSSLIEVFNYRKD